MAAYESASDEITVTAFEVSGSAIGTLEELGSLGSLPNGYADPEALCYAYVCGTPGVTHAVISSFKAYNESGQVVVEWETASEAGTVGFFLERRAKGGKFFRVNEDLLPGLLHSPQGGSYRVIDDGAVPGKTCTYRIVEVDTGNKKRAYGPFTVTVGGDGQGFSKKNETDTFSKYMFEDFSNNAHEISFQKKARIDARKIADKEAEKKSARAFKALERLGKKERKRHAKIAVTQNGMYCLDVPKIASLLHMSERNISKRIKKNRLSLSTGGKPVAWFPGENDMGICFYAEGIDSIYTKENIYWLDATGQGLEMKIVDGNGPGVVIAGEETFAETVHTEEDNYAPTAIFDDPETDYWLWDFVGAGYGWKSFTVKAHGAADSGEAELTVHLKGSTDTEADPDHHVLVRVNGMEIGESFWNGTDANDVTLSFDQSFLQDGDNIIEISGMLDTGAPYSFFYVDSFDLTYHRHYQAVDNTLFFRGDKNDIVAIEGFNGPDIYLFNVTKPRKPKLVTDTTVQETTNGFGISFAPADPDTKYLALTMDAFDTPVSFIADSPSGLKRKTNRAEYLVIAPQQIETVALALADYRRSMGLKSMVVALEDIYDEFNHGISSPEAICDFLSYAYKEWRRPPRYVVLAGEGTFDYKNNQGYGDNLVPPIMVDTPHGLFASDNRFADVKGNDGVPEMAIGRLPVMTAEELETVIDKIIAYENGGGGNWTDKVLMLADNPDADGDFPTDSDEIAGMLPPEYTAQKIYLSEHTINDARQLLFDGINEGALLLNYIGHGGLDRFAQEGMLISSDVAGFNNGNMLPVVTAMTCTAGRFAIPGFDSLGEVMVLHDSGGAVAREKVIRQQVPLSGSIDLTHQCNLSCVHCYLDDIARAGKTGRQELCTSRWISIIDEISEAGCLSLLITGGEPFLRKDFSEIYCHAKSKGILVTVFTNATLISESILDLFDDFPPHTVEISLYGATAETYEKITGIKGSYGKCLKGIKNLIDHQIRVKLKTILMTLNRHEFYEMEKMAEHYGIGFRFDPAIFPRFNGDDSPVDLRVPAREAVEKEFSNENRSRQWRDLFERMRGLTLSDALYHCGAGLSYFHIDAFGGLKPCLMIKDICYDLAHGTFMEGWKNNSARIRKKTAGVAYDCLQCEKISLCGFCPAFFAMETDSENICSDYLCALGHHRFHAVKNSNT